MAKKACCLGLVIAALWIGIWGLRTRRVHAAPAPPINLASAVKLQPQYAGSDTSVQPLASGQVRVLSLAAEDFNGDGIGDLAAGYAVNSGGGRVVYYRGSIDALAPQSQQSADTFARGGFLQPYLPDAQVVDLPGAPDFLAAGRFTGVNGPALLAATRGGTQLHVLALGASGGLELKQSIDLPGTVSALAAYDLHVGGYTEALIGVRTAAGPQLLIYTGTSDGPAAVTSLALNHDATSFAFGNLDGDLIPDVLMVAGGEAWILHGATQTLEPVRVSYPVAAAELGSFLFDRASLLQMALLGTDGTLHILAHSNIDSRRLTPREVQAQRLSARTQARPVLPPARYSAVWQEVENFPGAGHSDATGAAPLLFRSRISNTAGDDLLLLGSGNLSVIAHTDITAGSGLLLSRTDLAGYASAALPIRVSADGRPGVVFLKPGDTAPYVMRPLDSILSTVFAVNTTSDGVFAGACAALTANQCTLREAIREANATTGATITIPTGTYTLTLGRGSSADYTSATGALYVTSSVTITGTGNPVVKWGTPTSGSTDMLMSINPDVTSTTTASVSISGVTFDGTGAQNNGIQGVDGDGGCLAFDTGTIGTSTLSLTSVTVQNCTTVKGNGGGIAVFNLANGTGSLTFASGVIHGNSAQQSTGEATGGGVWVSDRASMLMSNSTVTANQAGQNGSAPGSGGGITVFSSAANSNQTTFHNTSITGNTATGFGGGIYATAKMLVDQASVISNNTAGSASSSNFGGGGIYMNVESPDAVTLTGITITSNSTTGNGGGIDTGNDSGAGPLVMTYCRLAGNSGSGNSSNLYNDNTTIATATDNWWGSNSPSGTIVNANGGTTTFDPFIVLTHTGSPATIYSNNSSTLTGDMSHDNHGTALTLSNLGAFAGVPITFNGPTLGTIPTSQPEALNSSAQATATFTAGTSSGTATANATVDGAVVAVNSSAISAATESGTTATLTTVGPHGFITGQTVAISGVPVTGYNGTFTVTGTPTANTFTYTIGAGFFPSSGGIANAGIVIVTHPSITKSFNPTKIAPSGTSAVTFSISNGNSFAIDASFTDTLPTNLVVASTPGVTNTCGSTVTANAGATSIGYSNGSLAHGTCSITVNVSASVDNTYSNSVAINSTSAGNGNTSTATLTVIAPPQMTTALGAVSIPLNSATTLTFTLTNPNTNLGYTGAGFKTAVSLPAGLVVSTPNGLSNTCGGTATATAGATSVNLTGVTLAANTSCTMALSVTGVLAGSQTVSAVPTSVEGGDGTTSNGSTVVVAGPTLSAAFGASSIPLNGTTTLTFTLNNPNSSTDFTGVQFSDSLPTGATIVVAATPGVSNTCGGTVTAVAGAGTISLSGGTLGHGASCTVVVTVTGTAAGTATNSAGSAGSTEGGAGAAATGATLNVVAPPTSSAAFSPTTVAINGNSTLTFTITSPAANPVALTGIGFTASLPTGLAVASTPSLTNTCGGTPTATAAGTSISLSGGSITTPGSTCTVSASVTASQAGSLSASTGNLSSTNGGTGTSNTSGTLTVGAAPSITAAFGTSTIPLNGTTTLTYSISNPNASLTLTGVGFTATVNLPGSINVVSPGSLTNTCGGTASATSSSVSLSGVSLAGSGSCSLSMTVQGVTAGAVSSAVTVTSSNGGTGNTSTAQMTVVAPPTISASFGAASVPLGSGTTFTVNIANPNSTAAGDLTGVGVSVTLPSSTGTLVVGATPGIVNTCGGSVTASAGSSSISLSGGSVSHSGSCAVTVNVTGTAAGAAALTTGAVGSTQGGTGLTAGASIAVVAPPSIAIAFGSSPIVLNATTSLTFTITNPAANTVALAGVAVANTLPAGLTVASTTSSACGGTLTTTSPTGIALSGASVPVSGTCQFSVTVTGASSGSYTNTTGTVSSTNGGTGNTGSANLSVQSNVTTTGLVSSLNPSGFGQSVTFTATVTGSGATPTGTVTFNVDGSSIGTVTLNGSGAATIATSTMAVGTRAITAVYSGDTTHATSTSAVLSQVVTLGATNIALVSSLNPSQSGQSVTFTATVTPQAGTGTPTSTVTFKDGVTTIGTGTLSSGVATFSTSSLSTGSHSITAIYSGDANYTTSTSSAVTQTVNKLTPTVALVSSVNPSVTGQLSTFTATVTGSGATPTGTVTVNVDSSPVGTITLAGGTGTLSVALTATGATRAVIAAYGSDSIYASANSPTLNQTVNQAATTTTLAASSNPALSGASVTFTATVSAVAPGQGAPTGTVTFSDGMSTLGTGTLSGGVATFATSSLSVTSHSITAAYGATAAFAASTSSPLNESISSTGTAVALNSSANPSVLGQSVTLTATVTGSGATIPAGTVQFYVGGNPLGSAVTLDGAGTGTLPTAVLPGGTSSITATYTSTNSLSGSTSGPLAQVVLVPVTVQANPAGAQFTVDGTPYTTAQTFNWTAGSLHSFGAPSPQALSGTSQLAFSTWSDSGAAAHTITTPAIATTYTANYATQYLVQVSINPTIGGSATGAGYYTAGTTATLTALPASGYTFSTWSGGVIGATNPIGFTVTAATTVAANFSPVAPQLSVAVGTRVDGTDTGTRNVNISLTDTGSGPAYNAQISGITSITVLSGSGPVTLASGIPGPAPGVTLSALGGSTTVPLVFNWPTTATRVSITFRMTATDASGTSTYPFTQTVTTFR
jgi:predicted outer membrane repeat protein